MEPATAPMSQATLPVIDISALFDRAWPAARQEVSARIAEACRLHGFFCISGHRGQGGYNAPPEKYP